MTENTISTTTLEHLIAMTGVIDIHCVQNDETKKPEYSVTIDTFVAVEKAFTFDSAINLAYEWFRREGRKPLADLWWERRQKEIGHKEDNLT